MVTGESCQKTIGAKVTGGTQGGNGSFVAKPNASSARDTHSPTEARQ
ncbi:MAG: hypothetical protein U0Q16_36925 [Bryobacteraceae bacterium]